MCPMHMGVVSMEESGNHRPRNIDPTQWGFGRLVVGEQTVLIDVAEQGHGLYC